VPAHKPQLPTHAGNQVRVHRFVLSLNSVDPMVLSYAVTGCKAVTPARGPHWLVRPLAVTVLQPWTAHGSHVRVLVIEDDEELADAIVSGLRLEQMAVDVAYDGVSGLERALVNDYDVTVLDRDLPGMRGDDVCAEMIAAGRRSRVLMLTAAAAIEDRVEGLGIGADDYLPKPFAFDELVARLEALLRRSQPAIPPVLIHGDVTLDRARRTASRGGRHLDLGPKEFQVLEVLLAAQGRVVPAEELLERVWDEAADQFTTAVKVTVSRLRRKLREPDIVETVSRVGYRISA
jgi:DNA-binding response OmpR family regulator